MAESSTHWLPMLAVQPLGASRQWVIVSKHSSPEPEGIAPGGMEDSQK
jgi:hypothetical protein